MKDDMIHFFKPVISDNTSGSAALLDKILNVFQTNFGKKLVTDTKLLDVVHQVSDHFQSFPVIQHFLKSLPNENNESMQLTDYIENYLHCWDNKLQDLMNHALANICPFHRKILIHSNSSTVIKLLVQLKTKQQSSLIQLESRPSLEGRLQAETLLERGYEITFVTDAMANEMMKQADLVILAACRT